MPTYRLTIEYDGTRYHGWQGQAAVRTVSGEIRRAIEDLGPVVDLGGAGRTDAGVHAVAQTAHLRVRSAINLVNFVRDVNDRLPADIHVLSAVAAPERFHARHDARSRSYIYQIATRRTAFGKRFVWWVKSPLDRAEMTRAAEAFVGRHDFRRFCERPTEQPSTLVEVDRIELIDDGDLLLVRIVASHFLWKMVRRVVGTLVRVGSGELRAGDIGELLDPASTRTALGMPAEWTAPAAGLFLERVLYEGEPGLGEAVAPVPVRSVEPPAAPRSRPAAPPAPGRRFVTNKQPGARTASRERPKGFGKPPGRRKP